MPWRDYIVVEELPELYRYIAAVVGRDAMITLAQRLPKMNLYLRSPESVDLDKPISELPEDYQLCINAIGVDATIRLANALPGEIFYLKSYHSVFLPAKVKYIQAHFDGRNHKRLAMDTDLSQTYVYEALRYKKQGKELTQSTNQEREKS